MSLPHSLKETYQELSHAYQDKVKQVQKLEARVAHAETNLARLKGILTDARRARRVAMKKMKASKHALQVSETIDLVDSGGDQKEAVKDEKVPALKDDVPDEIHSVIAAVHHDEKVHSSTIIDLCDDDEVIVNERQAMMGVDTHEESAGMDVREEAVDHNDVEETATADGHAEEEASSVAPADFGVDKNACVTQGEIDDEVEEKGEEEEDDGEEEEDALSYCDERADYDDDNDDDKDFRERPILILPSGMADRQLRRSVGRTRDELNKLPKIRQYMNDCKFGQAVVSHKRGRVYAITLNDQWNVLVKRVDELQEWYVGVGAMRRKNANLVAQSAVPIPVFQSPKVKERTCKIHYVGHYSVLSMHKLKGQPDIMKKERQLLVRFSFTHFDVTFARIIAGTIG
jgi:hypothetical protein